MQLRALFQLEGIAAADVAVLFHVSDKPALHRALPMLAEEEPALFDAFQNQHGTRIEATIRKRRFLASFVNTGARDYCFTGLFEVRGQQFHSMQELDADQRRAELQRRFNDTSFVSLGHATGAAGRLVFDLVLRPELSALIGRLFVAKPGGRAYARLAENLDCPVVEIARARRLVPPAPEWRNFVLTAAEVRALPRDWAARLAEWRGVYLIVDQQDGARYVGSAYGAENLLGRWRAHVAGARGVTVELAQRDPASFRFSILQRLDPDLAPDQVIAVEQNWKRRLDTVSHGLNRA
ncbi:MAG: GIY-YIG nuclease family protein [Pseudorhodobacter sp.]|nr:GIY-YIG nuclease family protein [Pseudorhodobacter sp.]